MTVWYQLSDSASLPVRDNWDRGGSSAAMGGWRFSSSAADSNLSGDPCYDSRMAMTARISWRIKPDLRKALEAEVRRRGITLAALLRQIADEVLEKRRQERTGHDRTAY